MLWQNQEKRNQFDMKQGSIRDCFFLLFHFVSFRFLHTIQLSSHCLMKRRNETPHVHSWPPPRLAVLHSRVTGANGRGTLLSSPKKLSSPSHLTCGVKTPGSSGDLESCCALPPGGLSTGDAGPVPSRGPFQPPHPFMQKSEWVRTPAQEREYFFHLMARLSSPARVVNCAAAHPGYIFAVGGCRAWLKLLNLGDKQSDR